MGGGVQLDAALQDGAAGEIVLKSENKIALRKGPAGEGMRLKIDLEEDSDKSVQASNRRACVCRARSVLLGFCLFVVRCAPYNAHSATFCVMCFLGICLRVQFAACCVLHAACRVLRESRIG